MPFLRHIIVFRKMDSYGGLFSEDSATVLDHLPKELRDITLEYFYSKKWEILSKEPVTPKEVQHLLVTYEQVTVLRTWGPGHGWVVSWEASQQKPVTDAYRMMESRRGYREGDAANSAEKHWPSRLIAGKLANRLMEMTLSVPSEIGDGYDLILPSVLDAFWLLKYRARHFPLQVERARSATLRLLDDVIEFFQRAGDLRLLYFYLRASQKRFGLEDIPSVRAITQPGAIAGHRERLRAALELAIVLDVSHKIPCGISLHGILITTGIILIENVTSCDVNNDGERMDSYQTLFSERSTTILDHLPQELRDITLDYLYAKKWEVMSREPVTREEALQLLQTYGEVTFFRFLGGGECWFASWELSKHDPGPPSNPYLERTGIMGVGGKLGDEEVWSRWMTRADLVRKIIGVSVDGGSGDGDTSDEESVTLLSLSDTFRLLKWRARNFPSPGMMARSATLKLMDTVIERYAANPLALFLYLDSSVQAFGLEWSLPRGMTLTDKIERHRATLQQAIESML